MEPATNACTPPVFYPGSDSVAHCHSCCQGPQSSTMLAHSVGSGVSLGASPPPLTLTTSSSYTISGAHKPMAPSDVFMPGISPQISDPMAYLALPWRVSTQTVCTRVTPTSLQSPTAPATSRPPSAMLSVTYHPSACTKSSCVT